MSKRPLRTRRTFITMIERLFWVRKALNYYFWSLIAGLSGHSYRFWIYWTSGSLKIMKVWFYDYLVWSLIKGEVYRHPLIRPQKSSIQSISGVFGEFSNWGTNLIFWSFKNFTAFSRNELPQNLAKIYIECFLEDFMCKALTFLLSNCPYYNCNNWFL